MDALITYAESRSLNLKQWERQKDWVFPQATPKKVMKCARDNKRSRPNPFKEMEKNSVPIFIQYRTELIYLLKPANFMFWLYEKWFQVYQLAV